MHGYQLARLNETLQVNGTLTQKELKGFGFYDFIGQHAVTKVHREMLALWTILIVVEIDSVSLSGLILFPILGRKVTPPSY